ncbi:hypothetical protein [Moorena bouillonii]|nr:hypothetical protein [Moorena bouillonii]
MSYQLSVINILAISHQPMRTLREQPLATLLEVPFMITATERTDKAKQ